MKRRKGRVELVERGGSRTNANGTTDTLSSPGGSYFMPDPGPGTGVDPHATNYPTSVKRMHTQRHRPASPAASLLLMMHLHRRQVDELDGLIRSHHNRTASLPKAVLFPEALRKLWCVVLEAFRSPSLERRKRDSLWLGRTVRASAGLREVPERTDTVSRTHVRNR